MHPSLGYARRPLTCRFGTWVAFLLTMKTQSILAVLVVGLGSGCGAPSTPGANPHDMSAADHATAAGKHDHMATSGDNGRDRCASVRANEVAFDGVCWTQGATSESDAHRKMAADHRAASQALRDAETKACGGVALADRDESPFAHRIDILAVEPVVTTSSKGEAPRAAGATISLRAVPGLTLEYLDHMVACHTARNAAMGFGMDDMAFCPLSVKGASAKVTQGTGALRVEIRGDSDAASTEILRRANALGVSAR